MFTIFEDPIQGALWSGPPFPSTGSTSATAARNPDSPAWLPTFKDGSILRFTNQNNTLDEPERRWGPIRCVYIQYASDPMVFLHPPEIFVLTISKNKTNRKEKAKLSKSKRKSTTV